MLIRIASPDYTPHSATTPPTLPNRLDRISQPQKPASRITKTILSLSTGRFLLIHLAQMRRVLNLAWTSSRRFWVRRYAATIVIRSLYQEGKRLGIVGGRLLSSSGKRMDQDMSLKGRDRK